MANQTLTLGTPSTPINFDSATLSGLANGETITINGGHLLINGDNRWGSNAAVVDSMSISSTLGGSILIDGRNVWEVPFSASTGSVPTTFEAGSNSISGSGVTGELLRVWGSARTPEAAGGVMPATGWIKLRSKTGNFAGVAVTLPGGATVTCSGDGKRSWIHIVAEEAGTVTLPRMGSFTIRGDWYELGTTNGADDQTFQYPVLDNCPAVQIETSAGSGEYEWYLNSGSRWGTAYVFAVADAVNKPMVPTDVRGKFFGMDNTTGVITLARRSSNACGYKPPTGCKVRVPNVMLSNSTATNFALNTINAAQATRYDFTTTAAGIVDIEYAVCNWYLSLTNPFRVSIKNTAVLQTLAISNVADTVTFDTAAVGLNSANDYVPISISNCLTSVSLNKVTGARYQLSAAGAAVLSIVDVANYTETDCVMVGFGGAATINRGNTTSGTRLFTRLVGSNYMVRPTSIGGYTNLATCANVKISDVRYADQMAISTDDGTSQYAFSVNSGSAFIEIDGFSNFGGLSGVHPYGGVVTVLSGSRSVKLSNIGTPLAPYNVGAIPGYEMSNALNAAVVTDIQIRRVYLQNTRTTPLTIANTTQGVVVDNVWGDAADSQAIAGIDLTARGCRWTNSVTGQSSVYGRHWEDAWTSTTTGRILIACNEPLASTASQCAATAGGPLFTSAGQVVMPVVGDQVTWTQQYFTLGVTAMANVIPVITGTNAGFTSGTQWTNFDFEFQHDRGSGFNGTWLAFNQATLFGLAAVNPATGIRFMVRATTRTASTTNALTYIRWDTTTTAVDQRIQYPLPQTQLTITGFEPGSDIVIYDNTVSATGDGSNVLATGDAVSGSFIFDYTGTPQIKIGVFKAGFVPQASPAINLSTSNSGYVIQQRNDRNYY